MTDKIKPIRILLVDDDEVDTRIIERNLRRSGLALELDKIVDPEIGKDLASNGTYECMLLDYRYPTGNAFELFADLLQTPCSQRPPVVLMTNMGNEGVAAQSIQFGAQEYLSKAEISPWTLRRMIESACEKSQLQRQIERREQELVRMSFFDSLTGLPNRQLFHDRLGQALREAERSRHEFAVLIMDLDLFKSVNDSFGHDVGDALLIEVGRRLTETMRDSDTVARIGGDEFGAILPVLDKVDSSFVVVENIVAAFAEPVPVGDRLLDIGISVGIAVYPQSGVSASDLVKHADSAMYEAKKNSSGIAYFNPESSRDFERNATIGQDLKQAIEQHQLEVHFQPQVRLADGALIGAEALVRWQHPTLGAIDPDTFIPMAERSRTIGKLTLNVLDLTLRQCRDWHRRGLALTASVNLSARVLHSEDIVDEIRALVERYAVPSSMLCFEVTETGIMQSPETAETILHALSGFAIRISIDDFGTGYSSLKYLQQFPIDEIKIDRDFVISLERGSADEKIVRSVIALGKSLDMTVVGEGVEHAGALQILAESGCDIAQGFHIGRPQSPAEFEAWREAWEADHDESR